MSDVNPPWRFGRSIVAVLVGMVVGVAITLGTDEILHIVGVFPPWGASMIGFDGALLLATIAPSTAYWAATSWRGSPPTGRCSMP